MDYIDMDKGGKVFVSQKEHARLKKNCIKIEGKNIELIEQVNYLKEEIASLKQLTGLI